MMKNLVLAAVTTSLLAGCATQSLDNKTAAAGTGSLMGCAGGAVAAYLVGGKPLAGCAAGAVIGGLIGFEKARQEEIAAAKKTQQDVVASMNGIKTQPIVTESVDVKDKATGQTKKVDAFKEVRFDFPLSQKGTPEFNAAMDKVKTLAERYADERGSIELIVAINPKDAKAQKVSETSQAITTPSGKGTIYFVKTADTSIDKGYERITLRAKNKNLNEA